MSITGSNNPFACDPVVFANANSIVSLGTITRDGNQFTFSVGFVWKINGVTYQNTAPVVLTIAEASEGFNRIDNALLNTSNTIELQQGLESETIALRPVAPETNIILTSWNISGTTIGDTAPSIVGVEFKKKIENTRYKSTLSGENVIIPFQAAGQSHYSVTNATLVSVAGFTTAGLTTPMYEGQDVIFENQTGHEITLKDSFGVDTSFVIGADLIVPNEGKIWFRFRNNELELIDKNWFKINEVATAQNLGEFIDGLDSKTDVKDTDEFVLSDSDDGLKAKKTRFLDLKTKLKSYFDTFYLSLSIFNDFVTDVFSSLDDKLDKSSTPSSVYGTDASGDQTMIPLTNFGTVKGTGTASRISKFTASGTIGDSQIFDNGTNVGVGAESTSARLDVRAQGSLATNIAFRVRNSADTANLFNVNGDGTAIFNLNTSTYIGSAFSFRKLGVEIVGFDSNGSFVANNVGPAKAYNITTGSIQFQGITGSPVWARIIRNGKFISIASNSVNSRGIHVDPEFGNLVVGDTADNESAILQANSTTRGFLPPRMTTAQRNAIATPAAGLVIYNTTTNKHEGFDGTNWNEFY